MKKATGGIGALLAIGAALLGTMALAGPADAKSKCPKPKSSLVPYVTYPCNGTVIKKGSFPVFKVHDPNSLAGKYHPFLNLQPKRTITKGHLTNKITGKGLFDKLNPLGGGNYSVKADKFDYPGYWRVTPGTYYLQVQQVDTRAGVGGFFYSPIIAFKVR